MANTHSIDSTNTDIEALQTSSATNLATNNTQQTAINLNTAKVGTPFTVSGTDVYINSKMIGLDNSTPNCTLDIGSGSGTPTIRLNGAENATTSSELIFSDVYASNDASTDYGAGCGIRWDSQNNQLQFIVDAQTGSLINGGYLQRHEFPSWNLPRVDVPTSFSMYGIDQKPLSQFFYASKVRRLSDNSDLDSMPVSNNEASFAWRNPIESGITSNISTGIITFSVAGLYHIKVNLGCSTTASQRQFKIKFRETITNTVVAQSFEHLSREEAATSYGFMQMDTIKYMPVGGIKMSLECDNDGAATIRNVLESDIIIKGLPLPNGYTIPTGYPTA